MRSILPLTATPGASSYVLERHLELARHERRPRRRLVPDELLEVALQALAELAPVEVVRRRCGDRVSTALRDAAAHQGDRLLDVRRA